MKSQKSLANAVTFEKYRKPTRREQFLAEMEQVVPWKELCSLIEPFYPKPGKGRPPIGLERMLRIHLSINTQIPAVNLHPLSRRCTHSLSTALE